jgi:ribosomal protein S18 acetylase RimI-like enzyme
LPRAKALARTPSSNDSGGAYCEARGQGIAGLFLAALERYAIAAAYKWLYLDSKDDLAAAIRFYEKQGYRYCERYNDNPQATIFMRKRIGPGGR